MREMAGDAEGVGPVGLFVPCPHLSAPYGPVAGADACISTKKMRLEWSQNVPEGERSFTPRKEGWRVGLGGDKPSAVEGNPFRAERFCISTAG